MRFSRILLKKNNGFELPSAKKALTCTGNKLECQRSYLGYMPFDLCISHNTPCFPQQPLPPYPLPPFSFAEASLRRRKAGERVDCQQSLYYLKICERVR